MPPLNAVLNGQLTDQSMWNQYRDLFRGGHIFDVVAGYGADNTGATDAAPKINEALTAAAGVGTVFIPGGTYLLVSQQILVPSNTTLIMHPQATIVRSFTNTSTIINKNAQYDIGGIGYWGPGDSNITIIGGNLTTSASHPSGQHLVMWQVTNLLIDSMQIGYTSYGAWMTWFINIYNAILNNLRLLNPHTTEGLNDGIHIESGRYITVSNCTVQTGDDAIALGSAGSISDDLRDVAITNCSLYAGGSRPLAIYTQSPKQVYGIQISNCVGHTDGASAPGFTVSDYYNTNTYSATVLADSPVAYYRLMETNGTSAADSSGNSHTATISASGITYQSAGALNHDVSPQPTVSPFSDFDYCFEFDGITGLVTSPVLTVGPSYSVEAFIQGGVPPATQRLLGFNNGFFLTYTGGAWSSEIQFNDGSGHAISSVQPVLDGSWHHIVFTYNNSNTTSALYIDGVLVSTSNAAAFVSPTGTAFGIGGTGTASWAGKVDEVAIYNTALTGARVLAHYNAANPPRLVHDVTLSNCRFTVNGDPFAAIIDRAYNVKCHAVTLEQASWGIFRSENITLDDCQSTVGGGSILCYADTVKGLDIRGGSFTGGAVGVQANYVKGGNWTGITCTGQTSETVYLLNCTGLRIIGCLLTPSGGAGFYATKCDWNVVYGNDLRWVNNYTASVTPSGGNSSYQGNLGYNPVGALGPPAFPASGTALQNPYAVDAMVRITCGAGVSVSQVQLTMYNTTTTLTGFTVAASTTSSVIRVPAGASISVTYTGGTPTWQWIGD